jgi:hypothetical protein
MGGAQGQVQAQSQMHKVNHRVPELNLSHKCKKSTNARRTHQMQEEPQMQESHKCKVSLKSHKHKESGTRSEAPIQGREDEEELPL